MKSLENKLEDKLPLEMGLSHAMRSYGKVALWILGVILANFVLLGLGYLFTASREWGAVTLLLITVIYSIWDSKKTTERSIKEAFARRVTERLLTISKISSSLATRKKIDGIPKSLTDSLSETELKILHLMLANDKSLREVAEEMKMPIGVTRSHLKNIINKLAKYLGIEVDSTIMLQKKYDDEA